VVGRIKFRVFSYRPLLGELVRIICCFADVRKFSALALHDLLNAPPIRSRQLIDRRDTSLLCAMKSSEAAIFSGEYRANGLRDSPARPPI
jgi:hypothetical protein